VASTNLEFVPQVPIKELTMPKAYLAHSSDDKPFVDRVANQLGRGFVVYDRMHFQPGVNLLNAIKAGLDESSMFVLFAGK
jgi:hypothetical protein